MKKIYKKILIIFIVIIFLVLMNFIRNYIILNNIKKLSTETISNFTNEKIILENSFHGNFYTEEYNIQEFPESCSLLTFTVQNGNIPFENLIFTIIKKENGMYKIKYGNYKKKSGSVFYTSYVYINKETGLVEMIESGLSTIKYRIEK